MLVGVEEMQGSGVEPRMDTNQREWTRVDTNEGVFGECWRLVRWGSSGLASIATLSFDGVSGILLLVFGEQLRARNAAR